MKIHHIQFHHVPSSSNIIIIILQNLIPYSRFSKMTSFIIKIHQANHKHSCKSISYSIIQLPTSYSVHVQVHFPFSESLSASQFHSSRSFNRWPWLNSGAAKLLSETRRWRILFSGEDGWISHGFLVSFHWCNQWFSPGFLWLSCWWGVLGGFSSHLQGWCAGDIMTLIMAMLLHQNRTKYLHICYTSSYNTQHIIYVYIYMQVCVYIYILVV